MRQSTMASRFMIAAGALGIAFICSCGPNDPLEQFIAWSATDGGKWIYYHERNGGRLQFVGRARGYD
jgi:hypothetical protein